MTSEILILGKSGQLAGAFIKLLGPRALIAGQPEIDFLDMNFIQKLEQWLAGRPVSAVINTAAYTQVDKAEGEGKEQAFRINGTAAAELAAWCKKRGLPLVHYSTDYVFDGSGNQPRREEDRPNPVNAYGASKFTGEEAIQKQGGDYLLFRTSWVYNATGKNFFNTILRLMKEKESLSVVDDQVGAPTYAPHLARTTMEALERAASAPRYPSGLYHLCNGGETSWCGFARSIFTLARSCDSSIICRQINPIPSSSYPLPAKRPLNSRLDCSRARNVLGIALPHWEAGLNDCIEEKYAGSRLSTAGPQDRTTQGTGG